MHLSRKLAGEKPMSHILKVGKFVQSHTLKMPATSVMGGGSNYKIPSINGTNNAGGSGSVTSLTQAKGGDFICYTASNVVSDPSGTTLTLTSSGSCTTFATYAAEYEFHGILGVNDTTLSSNEALGQLKLAFVGLDLAGNAVATEYVDLGSCTFNYGQFDVGSIVGTLRSTTSPIADVIVYASEANVLEKTTAEGNDLWVAGTSEMGFLSRKITIRGIEETDDICERQIHVHRIEGLSGNSSFSLRGSATLAGVISPDFAALGSSRPTRKDLDDQAVEAMMAKIFEKMPSATTGERADMAIQSVNEMLNELSSTGPNGEDASSEPIAAMAYDIDAKDWTKFAKKAGKFITSKKGRKAVDTTFAIAKMMGVPGAPAAEMGTKAAYRAYDRLK
jgi:hypothetical protein